MEFWKLFMNIIALWGTAGMLFWLCDIISPRPSKTAQLRLALLFGLLAVYLLEMAPLFRDVPIRIHTVIPLVASITFGPLAGLGCGIFCGLESLLFHGFLSYPAEVYMPLIAALIGSLLRLAGHFRPRNRFFSEGVLKPGWGFAAAFFTQVLYCFLLYQFYPGESAEALEQLWICAIPTVLFGAVCSFICLYVYRDRHW